MTARPLWLWCVLPAIAMSLGWGLRGSIGGGPLGAMIPGAMIGLVLCLLLGRESDAGRIAAFAAIGVGFGGQETYGQTVGLSLRLEAFRWAMAGFAVKGAVWGLLGGALIGAALARVEAKRVAVGLLLMVACAWIGWKLVNVPWWLAIAGAIGGSIGFAAGASLQPWGRDVWPTMPLGWWKAMELTFGALLGLSYGVSTWRLRNSLAGPEKRPAPARPLAGIALAALAVALTILAEERLPVRFGYTIGGAALASLVLLSDSLAWHTAVTATFAAFAWDSAPSAWAVVSTLVVAVAVGRYARVRTMFLLLGWTAVAASLRILPQESATVAAFVLLAIAVTIPIHADPTPTPD